VAREIDLDLRLRIEAITGHRIVTVSFVDRGYTSAERWVVRFEDGSSAFAKSGVDSTTSQPATWLRDEYRAYTQIEGVFMPRLLGWDDDGARPVLLIEDLSAAVWPPPWTAARIEAVLNTLDRVAATEPPAGAPDLEVTQRLRLSGWSRVAADPGPFLGLGLASADWLNSALPALVEAGTQAVLAGDALVHFDVRSDNICIDRGTAKLIDWNYVARGSRLFDRVAWAPSLRYEGGPEPWDLVPDSEGLAPLLSGYFAAQAGMPTIPTAPGVRGVQLKQLRVALPWAIRELGLPPLDGPNAAGR
jgi:Phosphotransferase enzyme family